jgi:beta-exotoxin I transport system permease protein
MTVFWKFLRDSRRSLLGWSLAVAAVSAMYAAFWPTVGDNPEPTKALDSYPQAMKEAFHMEDLSDPANYLGSTVFGLLIPLLVAVFAIAYGVKAVAADEEAGTLDLVLAHPVSRVSLALQRVAAIAAGLAIVSGATFLALLGVRGPAGMDRIGIGGLAAICVQLVLFGFVFAALAYAVGAATGRRVVALAVSAVVAVVAYLADSFLVQIEALSWTEKLSPFQWFLGGEPLKNGLQWGGSALLLTVAVVLVGVGTWRFQGRDVAV